MRIEAYDINKLDKVKGYNKSDNLKLLEEFAESGLDCAEVTDYVHKTATSCMNCLSVSIERYNMTGIQAMVRKGRVFLVKKSAIK